MSDAPHTDWDRIHRWEWFRREEWRHDFRGAVLGPGGGLCKAFYDLARLVNVQVALDAACGLGRATICLAEMGLNVLGSDVSQVAVDRAADLARLENTHASFFRSAWQDLPGNVPHPVNAILCDALETEPEWTALAAAFGGLFHALAPGGFLMFTGPVAGEDEGAARARLDACWNARAEEEVDWFHREGREACAKLVQRARGDDYIDERYLFVIDEGGAPRLESTVRRRPGYWAWSHWQELTRNAGFCHLETRTYEGLAADGGDLRVNVAWKSQDGERPPEADAREAPYRD